MLHFGILQKCFCILTLIGVIIIFMFWIFIVKTKFQKFPSSYKIKNRKKEEKEESIIWKPLSKTFTINKSKSIISKCIRELYITRTNTEDKALLSTSHLRIHSLPYSPLSHLATYQVWSKKLRLQTGMGMLVFKDYANTKNPRNPALVEEMCKWTLF